MADWDILELEGLREQVAKAAASVAVMYPTTHDAEDLKQEGLIWCAENADLVMKLAEQKDGLMSIRIWSILRDKVRTEAERESRSIGIHRLYEEGE